MIAAVKTDERTRTELGEAALTELLANLWPGDCQLCGRALGNVDPALVVDVLAGVSASAGLFHPGCRAPSWNDTGHVQATSEATLSFVTKSFLMPLTDPRGRQVLRATMLVNPSLESVTLRPHGGGWVVGTAAQYRQAGLGVLGVDFAGDRPVANARAWIREHDGDLELVVVFGDAVWTVGVNTQLAQEARAAGGIVLAVSTALHPDQITTLEPVVTASRAQTLLMGWIALADGPVVMPGQQAVDELLDWYHPRASVVDGDRMTIDPGKVLDNIALAMERIELDISTPISIEEDVVTFDELASLIATMHLGPSIAAHVVNNAMRIMSSGRYPEHLVRFPFPERFDLREMSGLRLSDEQHQIAKDIFNRRITSAADLTEDETAQVRRLDVDGQAQVFLALFYMYGAKLGAIQHRLGNQ